MDKSEIWLVQAKKDLDCRVSNLTNFANGNSINAGYYFVLFLETIYVYFSQSWMVTIMLDLSVTFRNTPAFEIEGTLNCYKKYNYRFTTMFLL